MAREFRPGDYVIYRKTKFSDHPGPRAADITPTANGDQYSYCVDKFWVVQHVSDDGQITLKTRRGKQNVVSTEDPLLRRANWFQRWLHRDRFRPADNTQPSEDGLQTA